MRFPPRVALGKRNNALNSKKVQHKEKKPNEIKRKTFLSKRWGVLVDEGLRKTLGSGLKKLKAPKKIKDWEK